MDLNVNNDKVYNEMMKLHNKRCQGFLVRPVNEGPICYARCSKCEVYLFRWLRNGQVAESED